MEEMILLDCIRSSDVIGVVICVQQKSMFYEAGC